MLPRFIEILDTLEREIYFIDEATFSVSQTRRYAWSLPGSDGPQQPVNSLYFVGVAVIVAINMDGQIVKLMTRERGIDKFKVLEFLTKLGQIPTSKPKAIFLDNLMAHHSIEAG